MPGERAQQQERAHADGRGEQQAQVPCGHRGQLSRTVTRVSQKGHGIRDRRADPPCMAYADLHFHLLPGVDDGPGDMDASLELARRAVADGIGTVVATPHVRADFG